MNKIQFTLRQAQIFDAFDYFMKLLSSTENCDLYVDGQTYETGPYGKEEKYEEHLVVKSDTVDELFMIQNDVYQAVELLMLENEERRENFKTFLESPKDFIEFVTAFMYAELYDGPKDGSTSHYKVDGNATRMLGKTS